MKNDYYEAEARECETANKSAALEQIYADLHKGEVYGLDQFNCHFPYFWSNLYLVESRDKTYIGWNEHGSSAEPDDIENLSWIIGTIFEQTPEEFLLTHIKRSESKVY